MAVEIVITEELKERTAITVMRMMVMSLAEKRGISFEEALFEFVQSDTYEALFDFETAIWKEGPVYLNSLYQRELADSGIAQLQETV